MYSNFSINLTCIQPIMYSFGNMKAWKYNRYQVADSNGEKQFHPIIYTISNKTSYL